MPSPGKAGKTSPGHLRSGLGSFPTSSYGSGPVRVEEVVFTNQGDSIMRTILDTLDPETYGFSRTPVALGIIVLIVGGIILAKAIKLMHEVQTGSGLSLGQ